MTKMREILRKIFLTVTLCLFTVTGAQAGPKICPPPPPLVEGQDDLRMKEEDFTAERFASSLSILETDIPKELQDKDTKKVLARLDSSEFWIGYSNSLKFIRGYMLKQAALLPITQARLTKKTKQRDEAIKAFCNFVGSADYSD